MVSSLAGRFGGLELVGVQAIIKDLNKYLAGAQSINAANASMSASAQAAASGSTAAGTKTIASFAKVGAAGAIAATLIGGASLRAAIDFESAFAGVRKTVDATEEEFAALEQGIRNMAKEVPASTTAIAAVAEAAGQLGVATPNILEFTRVMIDLGETTNLTADEAASAAARIANVMQLPQDQFDEFGSTLVDLGNKSASTESEIIGFAERIAGAGKIANLTTADVLSIGSAMASVGVEAEAGGTAVQKVLISMTQAVAEGGEKLDLFAAVAGESAEDFAAMWETNAAGAFTQFVEGLGKSGDTAFQILDQLELKDQRLIRAFLSLAGAGDLLRTNIDNGTTAWRNNTALVTEAEKRYATTASQLKITKNSVNDLGISIGRILLPALNLILKGLQAIVANKALTVAAILAIGAAFAIALGPGSAAVAAVLGIIALVGLLASQGQKVANFLNGLFGLQGGMINASLGEVDAAKKSGDIEGFLKGKGVPGYALEELTGKIRDMDTAAGEATPTLAATGAETGAFDEYLDGLGLTAGEAGDAAGGAAQKFDVLGDGIIDFAEAAREGFSAYEAGAIEAIDLIAQEESRAAQDAFEFAKTLAKVAVAFEKSEAAAQRYVLTLAREALEKTRSAASAIFARPTREQASAELQVMLAERNAGNVSNATGPQLEALEAQRKAIESSSEGLDLFALSMKGAQKQYSDQASAIKSASDAQIQAIERELRYNDDLTDDQREARQQEIDSIRAASDARLAEIAKEAERSAAAQEQTARILEAEKERQLGAIDVEEDRLKRQEAVAQAQVDAAQRQVDLYSQNAEILQKQIELADKTLLIEGERNAAAQELIAMTALQSQAVRDLTAELGIDLIPEMDEARKAHEQLTGALRVLTDESFRAQFIPAIDAAAVRAQLLADAAGNAAGNTTALADALRKAKEAQEGQTAAMQKQTLSIPSFPFPQFPTMQQPFPGKAEGGFVFSPQTVRVGEGYNPEAIIPLNKPQRAREIMAHMPPGLISGGGSRGGGSSTTIAIENVTLPNVSNPEQFIDELDRLQTHRLRLEKLGLATR